MTGSTNNKYIITAGAMNEFGNKASYSTPGASVLVSSFGGENLDDKDQSVNSGFGITSADITVQHWAITRPAWPTAIIHSRTPEHPIPAPWSEQPPL